LGVPACFAAQSACYGLRYRFGAVRTMLTHALRMPNAEEVFFMGLSGLPTHPPPSRNEVKNTSFLLNMQVFARAGASPPPSQFMLYSFEKERITR
jgi:hypothetical protein